MKSCRLTSQLVALLLVIIAVTGSPTMAKNPGANEDGFQFASHADGTFSITAKKIPLALLLARIKEETGIAIYADNAVDDRLVSIDASHITLIQLAQRIAGNNYAIAFDGRRVATMHILPQGEPKANEGRIAYSDFSGQVKIVNQRAKMFFMPADNSKEAISNYIRNRHQTLLSLSKEEPQKPLHAQISFQGYMSSDQVLAFVRDNNLDPVTFNIGWKENGGGYDLKRGEPVEVAIESAEMHHKRFIDQIREDADMQIDSLRQQGMTDKQMKPELAFQENAHELDSVYRDTGVPFYGIRVSASAKQLNHLVGNDSEVRLVDPLWGGSVEDEITNAYPMTKIAIPLTPVTEAFIP